MKKMKTELNTLGQVLLVVSMLSALVSIALTQFFVVYCGNLWGLFGIPVFFLCSALCVKLGDIENEDARRI